MSRTASGTIIAMRTPQTLRRMDDRVLGDRFKRRTTTEPGTTGGGTTVVERPERSADPRPPSTGQGLREFLTIFYRVARLVLLLLAVAVLLGIVFTVAPTNGDNVIVRNVLDLADGAAGPFRDVFTVDGDAERELVVNYAFAALVYFALSVVVGKLPGGKR